jgi:hypothetical protein
MCYALRLEECEKVGIDTIRFRGAQTVGCAGVNLERCVFDDLHGLTARVIQWHDLIVIALQNQRRNVNFFEIQRVVDL